DIAVLVLAILLHDCGMHLTQDGFRALSRDTRPPIISGLGDATWHLIWTDFLSEAQRFGEDRLIAVFGDATPISIENIDINNLGEKDCL
ncbi:HD domain-containing protein, partial [Bacillus amyloliquefaciens]|uniref:HD domain-containing protein n=1 Tax=Bacillus amyloliquefaciens TaxID=1390 RepID=UPI00197A845E